MSLSMFTLLGFLLVWVGKIDTGAPGVGEAGRRFIYTEPDERILPTVIPISPSPPAPVFNQELVQNEQEGKQVLEMLNQTLTDPTVPESKKALLTSALHFVEGGVNPATMTSRIASNAGMDGASMASQKTMGWFVAPRCCKVVIPPLQIPHTLIVSYVCTEIYSESYTTRCGLFGWSRCNRSRPATRYNVCYRNDVFYENQPRPCPDEFIVCCKGFVFFKFACIRIADLRALLECIRNGTC